MTVDQIKLDRTSRVLCVRLDAMGDVLMTTPAIKSLKSSFGCEITLLTSKAGAAVTPFIPSIDNTIVYEAPWMKAKRTSDDTAVDRHMVNYLRSLRFDVAIIFTVYSQNPLPAALLCFLAGIECRVAYCRENPYQLLTHWFDEKEPHEFVRHEVQRQLDLVKRLGANSKRYGLEFQIPPDAVAMADRVLHSEGVESDLKLLVVHPGASVTSRRYRPEGFIKTLRVLSKANQFSVVFTGDSSEVSLIESIQSGLDLGAVNLAGKLELPVLAAIIQRADVLLSNNTGPVHIAAAVNTPVVDLYALTNPQHTPWQVPCRVLFKETDCRYCYKSICPKGHNGCLQWVEPAKIAEAVLEMADRKAWTADHANRSLTTVKPRVHTSPLPIMRSI